MFGHRDVTNNHEPVRAPDLFENLKQSIPLLPFAQQRTPSITTEGDGVKISRAVIPPERIQHFMKIGEGRNYDCDE
jgi:hypothetical protein